MPFKRYTLGVQYYYSWVARCDKCQKKFPESGGFYETEKTLAAALAAAGWKQTVERSFAEVLKNPNVVREVVCVDCLKSD